MRKIPSRRMLVSTIALYLVFAAASARAIFTILFDDVRDTSDLATLLVLLPVYLLLMLLEPGLRARNLAYLHGVIGLQAAITLFLLLSVAKLDFFSLLFIIPCVLGIQYFPDRTAFVWIISIVLLMEAALLVIFPLEESIGYVIIYPAAIFLFAGLSYLSQAAEEAQTRSEMLLADLQQANQKLQVYSTQVQELAATAERNRLARELHDSVTQIIFGLTLSAQAARILLDRDPSRAAAELDRIQALAQSALAEMRSLIQQLRPRPVAEEGLAAGLRRLAAEKQTANGLNVDLRVSGERRLPARVEEELYCVAQEALNNIVKHAQTDHARVTLTLEDGRPVELGIEDAGVGFDPARTENAPGHMGLSSMSERVQALGGALTIDSKPGKGTRVRVALAPEQEVEHAG